jgi:isopentenyl-diphosphate delta-isomerase
VERIPIATDEELIVLVDEDGLPTGTAEKWSSHHASTPLHLAFSCYVFDDDGMFLATRRALTKKVWPGVWSNTACGHPAPGESLANAIARRLDYELGMRVRDVDVVLPDHLYRAPAFQGIVEYEFCPVYVARAASRPLPNAVEVVDCAWVPWERFRSDALSDASDAYSWWCKNQLRELVAQPLLERYARPVAGPRA